MTKPRHAALLRGINVGGRNKVPMTELRAAFEAAGYEAVETYIQSGNVLFESERPRRSLEPDIEVMLKRRLGISLVVVVRSHAQLRSVIAKAPAGFGDRPERYHYDALFLKAPLTSHKVMSLVEPREGVDEAWAGTGVVYFSRLSDRRSQSRLSRIVGTPEYQRMTIRNWNTTRKLLGLLDRRRARSGD